jgi:hypothetical protein
VKVVAMANAISKAMNRMIKRQSRKHALEKAGSALKVAGGTAAFLGAIAGTALMVRAVNKKRAETRRLDLKKQTTLARASAAATAVGASAIRARVKREKVPR